MDTAGGLSVLARSFRLALTVEGLRPSTISHYTRDVSRFVQAYIDRSPASITAADVRAYIAALQEDHAPKTVREAQLALRRFFRFLLAEGEISRDPAAGIKLINVKPKPEPTYTASEVRRLRLACSIKTREGVRNLALILALYDTAVREGELVSMTIPDWDKRLVRVRGKTGTRNVPLGLATIQAIDRYVRRWGIKEGPLWLGKKGPLTGSGVFQIVRRLCAQADVTPRGVHALRRASAIAMKHNGMNDSDIMTIAGWQSIEMLRRYTQAEAEELAQGAHQRYSPADGLRS